LCEKVAQKDMLAGRSPITIVAACLYFVSCLSENGCTSKDIADTCQCTESTLKNAYRILYEQRIELIEGLGMKLDASHLPS
jgi:transcription initiation factor TFIIB